MASGQEFWLVATHVDKNDTGAKARIFQQLQSQATLNKPRKAEVGGVWNMEVPDGEGSLGFGSFNNLVILDDELKKADSTVDGIVHRMERQLLEVDPKAKFMVKVMVSGQVKDFAFTDYIRAWKWDEGKYPKQRSLQDNLEHLMKTISKIDEDTRNKTQAYNEAKAQHGNVAAKEGGNLLSRDLTDVLTPDVVKELKGSGSDSLIYSEHLTTVVVILTRGQDKEFIKSYESMSKHVVPQSHKQIAQPDKDGNMIWRVVTFKEGVEEFKKACRDKRFAPRDFEYTNEGYSKLKDQRAKAQEQYDQLSARIKELYSSVWSDAMISLMHIKAMRIFVESVLRFGLPPSFAAFAIAPTGGHPAARKVLKDILGAKSEHGDKAAGVADDGDEYFPYVSFSFTPFTAQRDK